MVFKKTSLGESWNEKAIIEPSKAIGIARRFLMQYHSPVIFKSVSLTNKIWMVSMEVGLLKEDIMAVRIDGETGKILGYDHMLSY